MDDFGRRIVDLQKKFTVITFGSSSSNFRIPLFQFLVNKLILLYRYVSLWFLFLFGAVKIFY